MRAAGAPVETVSRADVEARIPLLAAGHAWGGGIWDPLAGSLRVRRTLHALAARLDVRRETVTDLDAIEADAVLVCAGLGTADLFPALAMRTERHVRVTYEAPRSAACVISPELYGLPVGSTGRYAIGMHTLGAEPTRFAGLTPHSTLECVSLFAPWLDAHGDGFLALQEGRVTAFHGSNLMKFGPLLGDRLAPLRPRRPRAPRPKPAPISITPVTASTMPPYWIRLSRSPRKATESNATIAG